MASLIDINPNHLDVVRNILRRHLPRGVRVWVFGSRAKWTTSDSSDLDLAIEGSRRLDSKSMMELEIAFDESNLPYTVDVLDLNAIDDKFRRIVDGQKVLLPVENTPNGTDGAWIRRSFGECATLVRETASHVDSRDAPHVGPEHMTKGVLNAGSANNNDAKTRFRKGDILFGNLHPHVGKIARPQFDGVCSGDVWVVRPAEGIDADFLFYLMASPEFGKFVTSNSEDMRMPRVWKCVSRYEVLVPPLQEQLAICHMLKVLDGKIELNLRMCQTLEEMALALFKSWFVNFDPVRAKLSGSWKRGESLSGMPAHLFDAFPDKLISSELGHIPKGWTASTVGDCFNMTMGQSPPSYTYGGMGGGMPFFQDGTDFGSRYPKNKKYCTAPTRVAHAGDTLVSIRSPIWATNMAWEKCCAGDGVAVLKHKTGSRSFAYYAVRSLRDPKLHEQVETELGTITKKQLETLKVVAPPTGLVECFEAYAAVWDERIRTNTANSRSLVLQRSVLLTRLISGASRPAIPP